MSRSAIAVLVSAVVVAGAVAASAACGTSKDTGAPAPAPAAFAYRGAACGYDVAIPDRFAFTDVALDDAASPGSAPARVRLGLGGSVTSGAPGYADPSKSAAFTWETPDKVRAARVRLGDRPDALADVRMGFSWTTPPPDVGFGSNEPETYMHEVHVCGLLPSHTYYYQVGGGTPEAWSATQSFTTVPANGQVKVGILGDARDKVDVWQLAQRRMRDAAVNLQLTSGDLVFVGTQESLYQQWLDAIWKDPADTTRFITLGQQMMLMVPGNHENDAARFYAAFSMPGEGQYAESYSSFDVLNTHVVMIDDQPIADLEGSEHAQTILKWLDEDLTRAESNRANVPFIAVVGHRGLYTTSNHGTDADVILARKLLAPIYDRHKVDLVVNGHDHVFERTKSLHPGADPAGDPVVVADGQGTVYVVNAGAGASPYGFSATPVPFREKAETFGGTTPYVGFYAVMTLEARKLTFTSYGLTTSGADPIIDTFDLTH